jgi:hypothetical protein
MEIELPFEPPDNSAEYNAFIDKWSRDFPNWKFLPVIPVDLNGLPTGEIAFTIMDSAYHHIAMFRADDFEKYLPKYRWLHDRVRR